MQVAVHNGRFHADDVFSVATLKLAGVVSKVVRTRDVTILENSDLRVDVGRKNNPGIGDFDHHQPGGAGERENGIPYASFGLIWQKYGAKVAGSAEASKKIDERLVQVVDADDVGFDLFTTKIEGVRPYDVSGLIGKFNPTWEEGSSDAQMDALFEQAVEFATSVLSKEIEHTQSLLKATKLVEEAIKKADDPRIIVLEQFAPWRDTVIAQAPQALYVVFPTWPAVRHQWSVYTVNKQVSSFENRKDLPAAWGGKEGEELAQATGVQDAVFCHSARFVVIAESKEGALELAKKAADN